MIFINGGYFKNEWAKPFEETLMIEASDIDSEDDEALGLYVNGSFVTGSIDGFLAPFVELPYKVRQFSIMIKRSRKKNFV